jgi:NAD(P)H-nitrite reductase large subunit
MRHYVIVGTGVAGIAAAEAIRAEDGEGTITLVGNEPQGFYSRPGLAYLLTGELRESQLFPFNSKEHLKRLNVQHRVGQVTRIHPAAHRIELQDASTLGYDALLLATGSAAARLGIPGEDLEGVVKLDSLDDTRRILRLARRTHNAVVTGGGITALELVEGLARRHIAAHYVLRSGRYWDNVLDETESRIVEHSLETDRVELYFRAELAEILGKGGRVTGVRLADGRTIRCEMVAVAIGVRPRIGLAQSAGMKTDRGIVVDDYLQSSCRDVFAAGDVAQVFDPVSGRSVIQSLWAPARSTGRVAGLNMAGRGVRYQQEPSFNVTRLAGLTTTIIGSVGGNRDSAAPDIAHGDSEAWSLLPGREMGGVIAAQSGFEVNHLRLMVGHQTLIGAVLMGDQTLSQPLQNLIASGADISADREQLLQANGSLAPVIIDFWTNWKKAPHG